MIQIDDDFPGGNIIIDRVNGDDVWLRQDRRDSTEWWFYWHFRVRGAANRTLRFHFGDGDVFSAGGPCVLRDASWQWMGRDVVRDDAFSYDFGPDESEVFFAFCPPYRQSELDEFLSRNPAVEKQTLCVSEQGRDVEHLILPSSSGEAFVLFTARTHACESLANFVLEGIFLGWQMLPEAEVLCERVDLHAIPFLDKDGIENGDQGKMRAPHDHNRDFVSEPLYASTRALMQSAPQWRGECAFALDLHCPWIRAGRNEELFFLGLPPALHPRLQSFLALLESTQRGPLTFAARHTIMPGEEWFQGNEPTAANWMKSSLSPPIATTLEVPYALAGGQVVTAQAARLFGVDLVRAIALFLRS